MHVLRDEDEIRLRAECEVPGGVAKRSCIVQPADFPGGGHLSKE